jgi:hypothetical protein
MDLHHQHYHHPNMDGRRIRLYKGAGRPGRRRRRRLWRLWLLGVRRSAVSAE